ncbi:MAG TPA: NUDIX hydrolase [Bacillales bacterium]|nr:NUDIX hydrolase [Bacillales bacterium]
MTISEDEFSDIAVQAKQPDSVVVLAKDDDAFILIKQLRRPVGEHVIQLPGGGVEPGEDLESAARRELKEETGYTCGELHALGRLVPASWLSNEVTHVYYTAEIFCRRRNKSLKRTRTSRS